MAGIVLGAGLIPLAIFGSLFIGVTLLIFVNHKKVDTPFIFVVSSDGEQQEDMIIAEIKNNVKKYSIKTKSLTDNGMELTIEIRLRDNATKFCGVIKSLPGVKSTALVSYNGEYMS